MKNKKLINVLWGSICVLIIIIAVVVFNPLEGMFKFNKTKPTSTEIKEEKKEEKPEEKSEEKTEEKTEEKKDDSLNEIIKKQKEMVAKVANSYNAGTSKLNLLPSYNSTLKNNSTFVPTFQLIWNELEEKNGRPVVFLTDKDNKTVKLLNQKSYKKSDINDKYIYLKQGFATPELKSEIEKGIKAKFNETSDILDQFEFVKNSQFYFFYSMLKRDFEFKYSFDEIDNKTFGIKSSSDDLLKQNVKVLFYDDENNYAVKLLTKDEDEVILYKGKRKNTFEESFNYVMNHEVNKGFSSGDTLTVPNITIDTKEGYTDLTEKVFYDKNNDLKIISKILQTLKFKLNKDGGSVKSEAGMMYKNESLPLNGPIHYDFSDDFMLFVKNSNDKKPYLCLNINNIEEFR